MESNQILDPPIKSEGDPKDYRLIKLPNGLKALLIKTKTETSSEHESLAAANVTVGVGSFDETERALGLAHFLEHMVHMGSERYPEESGYNDFLTSNGGRRNAMTNCEYTTYFFDVSEKAFPEALDRLAQIMEAPLLLKKSMQREREAVDSEYQMHVSNDAVRCQSILKTLVRDTHPACQFDFGNLKSLKDHISDDDLHAELKEFHKKYVAKEMCVAVQSSRTLNEMEELVTRSFSSNKRESIEEAGRARAEFDDIFKPEFSTKIYYISPKTTKKAMMLTWLLPPVMQHYKCAPMKYISYVFNNGGQGGLSSYLKEKHLVSGIGLYMEESTFTSNSEYTLVRLVASVTDLGIENIDKILQAIFSYLLMLKETSIEEHRRLYNDQKDKKDIEFKFFEESPSIKNVLKQANRMMIYEDADILRGSDIYQALDENVISTIIDSMNQRNFNIIILNENHKSYNKKEKYFGTEYDEIDFPEEYQRLWVERSSNADFFLEQENPFKTTNFEIFTDENEALTHPHPVKVYGNDNCEVWHKLDQKFRMPNVILKLRLLSPIVMTSTENQLTMKVFEKILVFFIRKKFSQAVNAGYSVSTDYDRKGLVLAFKGYSEKFAHFVDLVTEFLPNCIEETDEAVFNMMREELRETFAMGLANNVAFNKDFFSKTLYNQHFTTFDLYRVINDVSLERLQKFVLKFFSDLKVNILAQGNITKSQTLAIVNTAQRNINFEVSTEDYERKRRCYQMPLGTSVLRMKSMMLNDDNSLIRNYYQIGRGSLRVKMMTKLIEMILSPKAYDFLRSKEQLGYAVACLSQKHAGIVGFNVVVMSQEKKNPCVKVLDKMEIFMNDIATKAIEDLTDDEFDSIKDSRIKKLLTEDLDLDGEFQQNWLQIESQEYVFDERELAAKVTMNLTKVDLQDFFKSFTQPKNMRKLSVQVIGNDNRDEQVNDSDKDRKLEIKLITEKLSDDETIITSIEDFQSRLLLNPVMKFEIQ